MLRPLTLLLGLVVLTLALQSCKKEPPPAPDENLLRAASRAHIRHVTESSPETPGQVGLAAILEQELEIADMHAQLAIQDPSNFSAILLHLHHVRHALDPSSEPSGPGKGYGVIRAAKETAKQIELAATVDGASNTVKLHSLHVATPANNIAHWGAQIMKISDEVLATKSIMSSYASAKQIAEMIRAMRFGQGTGTWRADEGGLQQLQQHLGFLVAGEGL